MVHRSTLIKILWILFLFQAEQVDEFFSNFGSSYLCFHMAAYCCALHTYNTLAPWMISHSRADVYRFLPSDLIDHIMYHVAAGVHTKWRTNASLGWTLLFGITIVWLTLHKDSFFVVWEKVWLHFAHVHLVSILPLVRFVTMKIQNFLWGTSHLRTSLIYLSSHS